MITLFHLISHAPPDALWKLLCSYLERFIRLESATPADDQIYWEPVPSEPTIHPSRPWKA